MTLEHMARALQMVRDSLEKGVPTMTTEELHVAHFEGQRRIAYRRFLTRMADIAAAGIEALPEDEGAWSSGDSNAAHAFQQIHSISLGAYDELDDEEGL